MRLTVLFTFCPHAGVAPTCDSSRRSGFGTLARDARPAQQGQLPSTSGLMPGLGGGGGGSPNKKLLSQGSQIPIGVKSHMLGLGGGGGG